MEKRKLLYEGSAKEVYLTEDPDLVILHFKDDATAFSGIKKAEIAGKGIYSNKISGIIFERLEKKGIPTHFVRLLSDREQVCRKVSIIPLEVIVRNIAAGSMAKRLGIPEGTRIENTIYELCYKSDELGHPLINDHHAVFLGAASYQELELIYELTTRINRDLTELFAAVGVDLVDLKLDFGRAADGSILLADEISPDTCRFWDAKTGAKLDKDRFRRDLGRVKEAYEEVLNRLTK